MSTIAGTNESMSSPGEVPSLCLPQQQFQENASASRLIRSLSEDSEETEYETDDFVETTRGDSAQEHWDESMRQLEQVFTCVLFPVVGRVLGRRMAQNLWVSWVDYRYLKSLASRATN